MPLGGIINKGVGILSDVAGGLFGRRGSEYGEIDPGGNIMGEAGEAGRFADKGQGLFFGTGEQMGDVVDQLGRQMRGEESLSAQQLRQGLQQNMAAQQSMAAGARPGNAAMAARTAAIQQGRLGAGMAGQQAMAGIAERQAAAQQLGALLAQKRQQELQAALGSRGQALGGYGTLEQARTSRYTADMGVPTTGEQILGALGGAAGAKMMSDRNVKTDVADGDKAATALLEGLKAHTYRYKDEKHGKGPQLGIMAQALEKAGLKQAVIETPEGKAVDAAKLAGALAAASSTLHRRVKKLEEAK